jgi:hypothetical protein
MKSFKQFISESYPKDRWITITDPEEKINNAKNLLDLVNIAYSKAPLGSFIKTVSDIKPSDWEVINLDDDPELESCVFFRTNRESDTWVGNKIQGIGHDGKFYNGVNSSKYAVDKIVELISQKGWWIEVSDALRSVLLRRYAGKFNIVTDVDILRKLYKDPELEMIDEKTYTRRLSNNLIVSETTLGNPILK